VDNASDSRYQTYLPPIFVDKDDRFSKISPFLFEIDSLYSEYARTNLFPGYSYGIMLNGRLVHSNCEGFLDTAKRNPVTVNSMFRIASMTKSFTAMAILKLRDEGKLRLDDAAYLYIPEMKNQRLTKDAPEISIRDLLSHSAGFPTDDPWADRKLDETEKSFEVFLKKGIIFSNPTGITFEYSNLGYTLLGKIITKTSGIPYQEFIKKFIWNPLGMTEASWDYTEIPPDRLALGYRFLDGVWKPEPILQDGAFGAMGGMIASLESFSRYLALHQYAWPPRNDPESDPLKRSSIREMHQPWKFRELKTDFKYAPGRECTLFNGYGYGLYWLKDSHGRIFIGHSGGLPGFGSNWFFMPDYGLGIILLANVTYAPAAAVNLRALDKILIDSQLQPQHLPPSSLLVERQKALLNLLPHWQEANRNFFAENFFLDRPVDSLKKEASDLFSKAGKITGVSSMHANNQLSGSFILEGENARLQVSFGLTPETPSLIQHYQIKELKTI
jgi:CubicO group peptidase (beta-lactamase class C family)